MREMVQHFAEGCFSAWSSPFGEARNEQANGSLMFDLSSQKKANLLQVRAPNQYPKAS